MRAPVKAAIPSDGAPGMKYAVADLKRLARGVRLIDANRWTSLSRALRKKQPHFCGIIDEVGQDPRCAAAHRFCALFASGALEHAERVLGRRPPVYPGHVINDMAAMVAQRQRHGVGRRACMWTSRIRRHVISGRGFDDDDSRWLCMMISALLATVEMWSRRRRQGERYGGAW